MPEDELAAAAGSANAFAELRAATDAVLALRFPSSRNMPSSLESAARDRLVQWCHGAPGDVSLLCALAARTHGDAAHQFLVDARELGEVVWARGLLTKGVGLCHGASGNAYAFLALYRATDESRWLARAQYFARFAIERSDEIAHKADRPDSLFEGIAGLGCLLADLITDPRAARFPGYEL